MLDAVDICASAQHQGLYLLKEANLVEVSIFFSFTRKPIVPCQILELTFSFVLVQRARTSARRKIRAILV